MTRSTSSRPGRARIARRFWHHVVVSTLIATAPGLAGAQTTPAAAGRVEGQIKDALDRPLAGVALRLEAPDGTVAGRATSDAGGHFAVTGIAPGLYSLIGERKDFQTGTTLVTVAAGRDVRADLVLASRTALELAVQAKRLNEARDNIAPSLGATVYDLNRGSLETQAQGDNAPFNDTLLRTPGVAQDSFGQLHVRGDHANVQYRVNGVLIPEGISGFGQVFDTRSADRVSLITGALPAQYGYRTAGIIDIQTKTGEHGNGGEMGMYGGSYGTLNPSLEDYGASGPFSWYVTGNYLQNKLGIESPDGSRNPIHDDSRQGKGLGYFSWLVNPDTRLSLLLGSSYGFFQIPNQVGIPTAFQVNGQTFFDSSKLDSTQREDNQFAALSLQQSFDKFDYQLTAFGRYSAVHFKPDQLGELLFNGSASTIDRTIGTFGVQDDNAYRLNEAHTIRQGVIVSADHALSNNDTLALPTDPTGAQLTDANGNLIDNPMRILDGSSKWGYLAGIYLQDEWKATDRLTLNYGARFDYYSAFVSDQQVSPRVNAVYKLTDKTTLHAGYAREFTPPPLELVGTTSVQKFIGTPLVGDPTNTLDSAVKVQKDHYFDAGATHQLTPELQVGIDGYYKDVQHLIDEGQFGPAVIFTPFNYKTGKIYGVELTGTYKREHFSAYGNFAYSVAQGRTIESSQFSFGTDELAYIATHNIYLDHDQTYTASVGASYAWDMGTTVYTDTIVGSGLRKGFANTQSLPAYYQMNLGASQKFSTAAFGAMTARFDVLNITDEKYELRDGTGIGVGAPQFGIRRAFFAGLSKQF